MTAFVRSARVYDALTAQKDYRRATRALVKAVRGVAPGARTVLDVGCGTGRHLQYLRDQFDVEGLDLSRQMLAIARKRCPDVRFHQGSLIDFKLSRRFDVVTCLFGQFDATRDGSIEVASNGIRHGGGARVNQQLSDGTGDAAHHVCQQDPIISTLRRHQVG